MTPKQIKKAEEAWNRRGLYFNHLFDKNADIREETDGEDFRHQQVSVGDTVFVASQGSGKIHQGMVWKIMGFGLSGRNYFVFVPDLGRTVIRASSYIARDISE